MKNGRAGKMMLAAVCIIVLTALLASGCGSKQATGQPIKIGAVLSTTGPNAPLGTSEQKALTLLQTQLNANGGVNGRPVNFIIVDDASDSTKAASAMSDLIKQQDVVAVIGSSGTGTTMPMVDIADQAMVPLEACAAGIKVTQADPASPPHPYVFRTPPTDLMAAQTVFDFLKNTLKVNKVAILYDSNAFGTSGNDVLKTLLPPAGIQIVSDQSYETKATDMTPQLNNIKATDAQAVVVWGTNPGPATIAKDMKQLGMDMPLVNSHGVANKTYIELAGDASNGVYLPAGRMLVPSSIPAGPWKDVVDKFIADFSKEYGTNPDTFAGHGWDAGNIIVNALKVSGVDRTKLRAQIENTKNYAGVDGIFNYSAKDHNGLNKNDLIMVRIVNGNWETLSVAGTAKTPNSAPSSSTSSSSTK